MGSFIYDSWNGAICHSAQNGPSGSLVHSALGQMRPALVLRCRTGQLATECRHRMVSRKANDSNLVVAAEHKSRPLKE